MKVYIAMGKDGYGGESVDKVFEDEDLAIKYVIKEVFCTNYFYTSKTIEEQRKLALQFLKIYDTIKK